MVKVYKPTKPYLLVVTKVGKQVNRQNSRVVHGYVTKRDAEYDAGVRSNRDSTVYYSVIESKKYWG